MDRDTGNARDGELDRLMERAAASVRQSLDATVDVEQRWRDLLGAAGVEPVPAHRRDGL